jgi:hypothetical protein
MAKPKGINAKKAKGMEIKANNKAAKDAVTARAQSAIEDANWQKGSNVKRTQKAELSALKADDAARKRAEKAALLAEEESGIKDNVKKTGGSGSNSGGAAAKKKKKKGNDMSLLEASLTGDADKKAKEKKKALRIKKEREERLKKEREKVAASSSSKSQSESEAVYVDDPLMANTNAMLGNAISDDTDMGTGGTGTLNASLSKDTVNATGMDAAAALSAMSISGTGKNGKIDEHPEKRMKALHMAFEEKMMVQMKEDYPGLKRSQYKEKIFNVWKKSPENPMNWPK